MDQSAVKQALIHVAIIQIGWVILVKRINYIKPRAPCTSFNNNRFIKGVEFSRLCAGEGSTSMKHPQCSLAFCSFFFFEKGNVAASANAHNNNILLMAKPVILLMPLPPTEMGFGKAGSNHARHIVSAVALMQRRIRYFQTVAYSLLYLHGTLPFGFDRYCYF